MPANRSFYEITSATANFERTEAHMVYDYWLFKNKKKPIKTRFFTRYDQHTIPKTKIYLGSVTGRTRPFVRALEEGKNHPYCARFNFRPTLFCFRFYSFVGARDRQRLYWFSRHHRKHLLLGGLEVRRGFESRNRSPIQNDDDDTSRYIYTSVLSCMGKSLGNSDGRTVLNSFDIRNVSSFAIGQRCQ